MNEAEQSDPKPNAVTEHKNNYVGDRRGKTKMETLIYICGALAVLSGAFSGYMAFWGSLRAKQTVALWVFYATVLFVITATFAYFQKRINEREAEEKRIGGSARACLSVKNARILEAVRGSESNTATIIDAPENTVKLRPGIIVVLETVIENSGDSPAGEARPTAFFGVLDSMLPEYPAYQGRAMSPFQSSQPLMPGRYFVLSSPALEITDKEVTGVLDRQKFLVMFGFVDYLDGDTKRKMKFHYVYDPMRLGMVTGPTHNRLDCNETKS